jgi:pyrroline-5-carboxylate reductase
MKLAVLGTGKLGEALLSGMLRAGRRAEDVLVTTRRDERAKELADRYGVRPVSNAQAAAEADVLLLTCKPQDADTLAAELSATLSTENLLVSFAAGIPTGYYERRFGIEVPVVRVMTNTPVLVDQAMSAISAGSFAAEHHLVITEELLSPVGRVVRVPESQQDAVTALSGSGPAYFYFLVEAMIDAGILLGLPRTGSRRICWCKPPWVRPRCCATPASTRSSCERQSPRRPARRSMPSLSWKNTASGRR